jgi:glycosyltransferase involved in cell wall biosynthesis
MGRFLLVVGTLEPRKNQALVVEAFDRLRHRHEDLGLVIVGRQGWMVDELVERIRSHPEFGRRLLWPDGVDDGQLAWLYRRAFLTVAASRYEGLGVPVMEALHHGCATIASTGGALAEAGDGRVETIDPDDVDGLVVAIERHLLDDDHHDDLVTRAAGYVPPAWADTTEAVAAALERFRELPPPVVGPRGEDW